MLTTSVVWFSITVSIFVQRAVHAAVDLRKCDGILMPSEPVYLFNNHCYMYDTDQMVWDDAQKACQTRRGNLAIIPDASTQQFLIKAAYDARFNNNNVWIGATDKQTEGRWKWVNGQDVTYKNWANGSPKLVRRKRFLFGGSDSVPDYYAGISDCVFMSIPKGGTWVDVPCHENKLRYPFICQFELRRPTTASTTTTTTTKTTTLPRTTTIPPPTTTIDTSTEETVVITTVEDDLNTTMMISNETITEEFSNFTIIANNSQPIDDTEHIDPDKMVLNRKHKRAIIVGLSVGIGLLAIMGLAAVIIVNRIRSEQQVHLDDVVAFDNSAYTAPKTDELQIDPTYFLDKPTVDPSISNENNHIYQIPNDTPEKIEDNSENVHV